MHSKFLLSVGLLGALIFSACSSVRFEPTGRNPYPGPGGEYPQQPPGEGGYAYPTQIPKGHFPPPGSCRIWYPDRPAGQQPPPDHCDTLASQVPPGAWLVSRVPGFEDQIYVSFYHATQPRTVLGSAWYDLKTGKFLRPAR